MTTKPRIDLIFPKPIYVIENVLVDQLPIFEAEIHRVMNQVPDDRNNKNSALNVASTFVANDSFHTNPVFKPLADFAMKAAKDFMKEMVYDQSLIDRAVFHKMWANRSYGDDFIFPHNHGLCMISGAFYIKAPTGAQITFYDDMRNTRHMQQEYNYLTWEEYYYDCIPGTMLLFRNEQLHGNKRQPDGEKIAISFNIGL